MIYFTSDLHLGHKNIIKLCHRPFASLEEMDETLVSNWNQVVTNGDTVYIVGDLMFRTQNHPSDVLRRLRGKKNLILGNHDRGWLNKTEAADFFKSVESYSEKRLVVKDSLITAADASSWLASLISHLHTHPLS